jgi:putative transposase
MTTIQRAYKTELDPNNEQATLFERFAEVRVFVYNIAIREWQRQYKNGEKPNANNLKKQFNACKHELFPYVTEAPYAVTEAAFRDIDAAFQHFFRRVKQGQTPGYPRFKKCADGFSVRNTRIEDDRVRVQGVGWVRLKERWYIPTTEGGLKFGVYATISKRAGRWYISVLVEEPAPELKDRHATVIGVDFGIKSLAVCSNGRVFDNPKPLYDAERKMARLQRELSRRRKGSANWNDTKDRLQKAHKRVVDIRAHTLHQISDYLTQEVRPAVIVLEDLNVAGMVKNHSLARAISDVGFSELRRQIEYKAQWYGIEVAIVDRFFPSSKTCSRCGVIKSDLTLSDRTFICSDCGFTLDRDMNAALNLAAFGQNRQTGGDCLGS